MYSWQSFYISMWVSPISTTLSLLILCVSNIVTGGCSILVDSAWYSKLDGGIHARMRPYLFIRLYLERILCFFNSFLYNQSFRSVDVLSGNYPWATLCEETVIQAIVNHMFCIIQVVSHCVNMQWCGLFQSSSDTLGHELTGLNIVRVIKHQTVLPCTNCSDYHSGPLLLTWFNWD